MSRNMRHRSAPTPARKPPQSSSQQSQDSDSDDDYGGVDDISAGEDDEPNVEVAEERAIISSEGEETPAASRSYKEYGPWEGIASEGDAASLDEKFFEQAVQKSSSVEESYDEDAAIEKHVHWESPVESDSETAGDSGADEFFPDLFVDKNEIDPHLLRQIETDDANQFSDDGFFYGDIYGEAESDQDLGPFEPLIPLGDYDMQHTEHIEDTEESSDADSDSSGYDSDISDTGMSTDEEDIPGRIIAPEKSILRATSEGSTSSSSGEVTRRRSGGPRLANWIHEGDSPYATADLATTKVKVYNMRRFRQEYTMQSRARAPQIFSPQQNVLQHSPMISNSGNIMMSAMMPDPFSDNVSGQAVGGPEAFYPWTYINANGTFENQDSSSVAGSDCDDEDLWNIDDLLNFGDDSDEEEGADRSDESPTGPEDTPGAPSSTPARPTTARSEDQVHPLLDHFRGGNVGAFRINQNRHQLLHRTSVTHDSLAFGNSYMEGTIRGVKVGRLHHANTPITPVRKKRPLPVESSPASPTPYNANKKRKCGGDERPVDTKRSRGLTM
ncbi:uncharacterized protein RAG0_12136 [Rhynchosporium agropyri]|uniref:Uncharacterized protein n=1 Tax=Rhynchosporium agropyri TaxID=914238 RepID=A0A1E1L7M4_9HELO|nr:uncharacterized protein RAG0_12136 [Rhynchosporium agropyri]